MESTEQDRDIDPIDQGHETKPISKATGWIIAIIVALFFIPTIIYISLNDPPETSDERRQQQIGDQAYAETVLDPPLVEHYRNELERSELCTMFEDYRECRAESDDYFDHEFAEQFLEEFVLKDGLETEVFWVTHGTGSPTIEIQHRPDYPSMSYEPSVE